MYFIIYMFWHPIHTKMGRFRFPCASLCFLNCNPNKNRVKFADALNRYIELFEVDFLCVISRRLICSSTMKGPYKNTSKTCYYLLN